MSQVITIQACLEAIELAKPLMSKDKHAVFVAQLRVKYAESNLAYYDSILALRKCATDFRNEAVMQHQRFTAMHVTVKNQLTALMNAQAAAKASKRKGSNK